MPALIDILDIAMFVALCALLMTGFPVAFTLAGTALIFALIGYGTGVFDLTFLSALPHRIFGTMTNEVLIAVPLFVFMGVMLEKSKVAEDLLETMSEAFGGFRGGLGLSVIIVGALLAASTGIVGATVVTMGLLSLPTMLKKGYDPRLASGAIAASGTLGQIIPPSIVLVVLGDQMSTAYQRAQLDSGVFSPETVTVGDLFAGALIPGLLLVGLYLAHHVFTAMTAPDRVADQAAAQESDIPTSRLLAALLPPLILIVAVLGSILSGIATPTEAAAVGAIGALLLAARRSGPQMRLPVDIAAASLAMLVLLAALFDLRAARSEIPLADLSAILAAIGLCLLTAWGLIAAMQRLMAAGTLNAVVQATARITSMVFVILIGAALFSLVFRGLGGDDLVHGILSDLPGGTLGALFAVMLLMFVLGFFLDFLEIVFVVVPLVAPALLMMQMPDGSPVSPVWLGVMMAVNLQTSFLTPPFGVALFYLRGVVPEEIRTADIYRGVIPFVALQVVALALLWLLPELATWLPGVVYGD